VQVKLNFKCKKCGHWNKFLVEKRAIEAPTSEPKATFLIRAYEPLKVEKCSNCGGLLGSPGELIIISHSQI
jgi:predicted nucleic-acid-binding Zn-ribbon protein